MNRHREIAQMMRAAAAPPTGEIPTNGLQNWWKFSEGSGADVLDYGLSPVNGEIRKNDVRSTTTDTDGNWVYDGVLGRNVYENKSSVVNSVSIDAWAFDINPYTFIFHVKNTAISGTGEMRIMDNQDGRLIIQVERKSPASSSVLEILEISAPFHNAFVGDFCGVGDWTQIAITASTDATLNMNFYIDGVAGVNRSQVMTLFRHTITKLCAHNSGTANSANGLQLTDVLFYNRVLSLSELAGIRNTVLG